MVLTHLKTEKNRRLYIALKNRACFRYFPSVFRPWWNSLILGILLLARLTLSICVKPYINFNLRVLTPLSILFLADVGSCRKDKIVELNETSGKIFSPMYPRDFPRGTSCTWLITAPEGLHVRLKLKKTELDGGCLSALHIRNGKDSSSPLLQKYCGQEPDKASSVFSSDRYLWVNFSSKNAVKGDYHAPGFRAEYEVVQQCKSRYLFMKNVVVCFIDNIQSIYSYQESKLIQGWEEATEKTEEYLFSGNKMQRTTKLQVLWRSTSTTFWRLICDLFRTDTSQCSFTYLFPVFLTR